MKKFVNDPKQLRPRDAQGHRAGQPRHAQVRARVQPDHAGRRAQRRQGLDRPGLRLRPRAGPRDGRRQGHARRRLPGRRVRRAADGLRATRPPSCSTRPRACCSWSTTTPATGWPSTWARRWPRPRASRIEIADRSTTTSRSRTRPTRSAGAAWPATSSSSRRSARPPSRAPTSTTWSGSATKVNAVTRTMGMALTACTPPAKGSPLFDLGDDEMEMGVGIHGEPGRAPREARRRRRDRRRAARGRRHRPAVQAGRRRGADDQRARRHADQRALPPVRAGPPAARRARGINVRRSYVGEYCTSLDMAGASLTLVKLDDEIERPARRAGRDRHPHLLADAGGRRPGLHRSGSSTASVRPRLSVRLPADP